MSSSDDLDALVRESRMSNEPGDAMGAALKERLDRRIAGAAAVLVPAHAARPTSPHVSTSEAPRAMSPRAGLVGVVAALTGIVCVGAFVIELGAGERRGPAARGTAESPPIVAPMPAEAREPESTKEILQGEPHAQSSPTVDVRALPDARVAPTGLNAGPTTTRAQMTRPPAEDDGSLEEETKLLRAARTARFAGAPERSLSLTSEHAARFPKGALAPERDAERISALCALGHRDEARQEIGRFEGRWPSSALLERVRASCRGVP